MDKHNKHHKNKAKGSDKPQSLQPTFAAVQEPIIGKAAETMVSAQKAKPSKGKQK
jgi:hypothetical protein